MVFVVDAWGKWPVSITSNNEHLNLFNFKVSLKNFLLHSGIKNCLQNCWHYRTLSVFTISSNFSPNLSKLKLPIQVSQQKWDVLFNWQWLQKADFEIIKEQISLTVFTSSLCLLSFASWSPHIRGCLYTYLINIKIG